MRTSCPHSHLIFSAVPFFISFIPISGFGRHEKIVSGISLKITLRMIQGELLVGINSGVEKIA
jgi:hypothetical protein